MHVYVLPDFNIISDIQCVETSRNKDTSKPDIPSMKIRVSYNDWPIIITQRSSQWKKTIELWNVNVLFTHNSNININNKYKSAYNLLAVQYSQWEFLMTWIRRQYIIPAFHGRPWPRYKYIIIHCITAECWCQVNARVSLTLTLI